MEERWGSHLYATEEPSISLHLTPRAPARTPHYAVVSADEGYRS